MKKFLIYPLTFIFLIAACATTPSELYTAGPFAALESGAAAYVYVDQRMARPVLDLMGIDGQVGGILDRTSDAVIGIYPQGGRRRFMAAARGSFPAFWAGFSFAFSPKWKKLSSESGNSYWHSAEQNLSIAVYGDRALVSDGDPFPSSPFAESPEEFSSLADGAAVAALLPGEQGLIAELFSSFGIPIRFPADRLSLAIYPASVFSADSEAEALYAAVFYLHFPASSQAKAIKSILNLARLQAPMAQSMPYSEIILLLLNAASEVQGNFLILKTKSVESSKIALLFSTFLL